MQNGVRDLDNRIRNLRNTLDSITNDLQTSDWASLRNNERRFRDETSTIQTNFNNTEFSTKDALIATENAIILAIQNEVCV
jgi:hypothetical protein